MRKFKKIYIEITNTCNLNCSFCPKTSREHKFMSCEEFKIIAEKLKGYGNYIYPHVLGEPLLHPDIEKILSVSENFGFKTIITTNGTLIKEKSDILLKSNSLHRVNVSLHSFEANENKICLSEYLKNIAQFALKLTEKGKICLLRLWNIDGEFTKAENLLNEEILKLLEKELGLSYTISSVLRKGKNLTVKKLLYIELAEKFQWPEISGKYKNEECFCYGLRDQIGILCDGTVIPCCLDREGDIGLGNIFKNSLEEILNSERAVKFYDGFTARTAVENLCKTCGFARRFQKKKENLL